MRVIRRLLLNLFMCADSAMCIDRVRSAILIVFYIYYPPFVCVFFSLFFSLSQPISQLKLSMTLAYIYSKCAFMLRIVCPELSGIIFSRFMKRHYMSFRMKIFRIMEKWVASKWLENGKLLWTYRLIILTSRRRRRRFCMQPKWCMLISEHFHISFCFYFFFAQSIH